MDIIEIIGIGQIIIFPLMLIVGGLWYPWYIFKKTNSSKWSFIYLSIFLIVVFLIGLPVVINNFKILTSKCKRCKGELDNKGRRIYANAWTPWKNAELVCKNCKAKKRKREFPRTP